jgi:hypothetical protein
MTERAPADAPAPPATPLMTALADDPRETIALAHALGVGESTLRRWKTGQHAPRSQATRRQVALALGFTVEELWPPRRAAA